MIKKFYDNIILKYPIFILTILLGFVFTMGYYATKLEIDASAETLLLDDDKDLQFYREMNKNYSNPNYLIVTFNPTKGSLLDKNSLSVLKNLSNDLLKVTGVDNITSILNAPLLQSPIKPITDLVDGVDTLSSKKSFDKNLVKKEFLNSELYSNALVSKDFKTTALVLNLIEDTKYTDFLNKRDPLLKKQRANTISTEEENKLILLQEEFKIHRNKVRIEQSKQIKNIREIIKKYQNEANIFLGGVQMISSDIISFVKNDLFIYGSSLVFILLFVLWYLFRHIRWIVLPIIICTLSVVSTAGVLGFFGWEVTVISSNFIALQLIITISIVLHLIVRYRELNTRYKHASQYKLVINTILSKFSPSFFAILTTITGFASLVLSSIEPVKNLGLMMSTGVAISLFIAFIVFPIVLIKLKKIPEKHFEQSNFSPIQSSIKIVKNSQKAIMLTTIIVVIFSLTGASKLIVENSFINYFKKSTPIYKGMEVIDENLGGTTPLDIIIQFKEEKKEIVEENDIFDEFENEFQSQTDDNKYWFSQDKMDTILSVHNYLDNINEIGKVQSLGTLLKLGKTLNKGKDLDAIMLALLYDKLPQKYKQLILSPYINIDKNQARITVRIKDSNPNLRRNDLINKINEDLRGIIKNKETTYRLSNLMLMYNNMLQSLFDSQIKTLGFVLVILLFMFLILFRSIKVALIALAVNIVPISAIFGIMGWLSIPLDIMTITIAAISIGIGVDDTIHYIHRFKEEFKHDHNYINAMERAHKSIGYAMYFTSLVIILGFSILLFSNLIPTIYFGLLTVVVMASLLASALLLLPRLLIIFKPYEKLKEVKL